MVTPNPKPIFALRQPTHLARALKEAESEWFMVECVLFGTSYLANKEVLIKLTNKFENMRFARMWTSAVMNKEMQLLCSSSPAYVIWRNGKEVGRVEVKDRGWEDGTVDGKPSEVLEKLEQWINAVFAKQHFIDNFRSDYTYTPKITCKDNITHLMPFGKSFSAQSWEEDSSGIMWVALRKLNLICLATMMNLDMEYVGGTYKTKSEEDVLMDLTKTIIFEIEAGAFQSDIRSFRKPYGIVSAMSGTKEVHDDTKKVGKGSHKVHEGSSSKALSDLCDKEAAINFLKEKMKKTSWDSVDDVIKTTILTLKCLCGSHNKKFSSKEIMVRILDEKDGRVLDRKVDVKNYLAA